MINKAGEDPLVVIDDWCEIVHSLAVSKGWWPDNVELRDIYEIIEDFHTELSEAWEEYRNGNMGLYWRKEGHADIRHTSDGPRPLDLLAWGWKPSGYFVELADLCIRIFDVVGAYGWELRLDDDIRHGLYVFVLVNKDDVAGIHDSIRSCISTIVESTCGLGGLDGGLKVHWGSSTVRNLAAIIWICLYVAAANGVSFFDLINLKHAYNETKPPQRGDKRV